MTDTKILIIDDDSGITEVLKSYFENEGYDVKVATDGMEGLNYFKILEMTFFRKNSLLGGDSFFSPDLFLTSKYFIFIRILK